MGRSSELDGLTTLPELLMQSIQKNGDREALRQYDRATGKWESWTYKELGEHVLAWRRAFAAMGLKPGERIAILMPNGRDHVCADQAALANGLIPVPLHAIDTPGASAFITIDSQAATLVTNKLTRWQQIRATGVGTAVAVGRLGAMSGPLLAGKMLALGTGRVGVMAASAPGILLAGLAVFILMSRKSQMPIPASGA